ncbi:MAG TPA: SDR family oxidoreductase [Actinomycetes bacterium]|nr:SDR family oxidoreductase [Actinomycetes bacterium]
MDVGLTDRVFLVTGGSRGLGRATAAALVAEGARVVVSARDAERLAGEVEAIGADHAVGVPADLTDPTAAERLVAAAIGRYGRIDGALISYGGPPPGGPLELTDDEWRTGFESVFLGPLRVARAVAAAIGDEGGALAFVLSSSVREPIAGLAASNGMRPGLAAVAKELSDELAPRGIRVNGLLPGRIDTDRTRLLDARSGRAETVRRRAEATIPLGRYGDPVEFGIVAAFLLSPAASYLTGVMLPVDGGARRSF